MTRGTVCNMIQEGKGELIAYDNGHLVWFLRADFAFGLGEFGDKAGAEAAKVKLLDKIAKRAARRAAKQQKGAI
ncbi:MAG: hypothetical protein NC548_38160 [Lachnospiraceae bacterium]|nr:hypothetical protein [Lachnospiraceae bacterium]